jgi:hypothetical protein
MSMVIRGAILSLVVFYLYVAYIVTHPNVSAAYRDYYIARSTDLTIAERRKLPPLQAGRDHDHKDAAIAFDHWSAPEETFRWNDGTSARIIFKLNAVPTAQAPGRLVVNLMPHGVQRTRWRLNGADLGERQVTGEAQLAFSLAPGMLRAGENVVEIDMPDARRPNTSDGRLLGLAFRSLRLE